MGMHVSGLQFPRLQSVSLLHPAHSAANENKAEKNLERSSAIVQLARILTPGCRRKKKAPSCVLFSAWLLT